MRVSHVYRLHNDVLLRILLKILYTYNTTIGSGLSCFSLMLLHTLVNIFFINQMSKST